tara:strand:- start:1358 stop:1555 length:198 start_codon:yes stop_codon:yes gene_type:complete
MIKWLKQLLGFKSELEKKQEQIRKLEEKAFQAQRNGDLSLAGDYQKQADEIADSIDKSNNQTHVK